MAVETIHEDATFASLSHPWDALVRAMPRPSPFLLHAWILEWWRHFGATSELAIHAAFRDASLVGAIPLCVTPRHGMRIASFVGRGESALADVLLADGEPSSVATHLVEHVAASDIDAVDLFGLPRESRLAAAAGRSRLTLMERVEAPVTRIGRDFEAFCAAKLPSSRRRELRRRARSLAALGTIEIEIARTPQALVAALDDAYRLHALRWGGRPDHSTFGTAVGQAFHRAALGSLARQDIARITTIKLDGRAIAFQCWFALGESVYFYRQAYDPEFARLGVGFSSFLEVLRSATEEGLVRAELLGGAEGYKLELADRMDPLYQGVGLARTVRGRAYVAARTAASMAFQRLRRSGPIRRLYYEGLHPARRVVASLRGSRP